MSPQSQKFVLYIFSTVSILAGLWFDHSYRSSTPDAKYTEGTIVDFVRPHRKQVYPICEFTDTDGHHHRVVSSTQQGIIRFREGEIISIAYSQSHPDNAHINTFWFCHRWFISSLVVALATMGAALRQKAENSSDSDVRRET